MISPINTENDRKPNLKYDLLDTYRIDNEEASRLAILRKVQFRNTRDGKPFLRLLLEDINGLVVIGRVFDFQYSSDASKKILALTGSLVLISYSTDYFNGSLALNVKSITALAENEANIYEGLFAGHYTLVDTKIRECNQILSMRGLSSELNNFRMTYCNLDLLKNYSNEQIYKGLRGYILSILHKVLIACSEVSDDTIIAFIYAVITEMNTSQNVESFKDDNKMLFIASMTDKRVDTASAHMPSLSNKISEFTSLFAGIGEVISADSWLVFNVYKTLCEHSNISVTELQLPPGGFCVYKNYTIRRD